MEIKVEKPRKPKGETQRFNFSSILKPSELQVVQHPETWRWISTMTKPDLKAIRYPAYHAWAKGNTHSPPQRELFLTLSGNAIFGIGEKVYRTVPGVVMLFNSRERHDLFTSPWNSEFRHLWLHISDQHSVFSNISEVNRERQAKDTSLKLISGHNPRLLLELWLMCQDAGSFSTVHWTFLKTVITTCFFEALGDWRNNVFTHPHQVVVNSIGAYIHDNLEKELDLESLSSLAGYSPYFFHRIFLKYAKKTLHLYIIDAKLERAKALLESGQSVSAVSEQVGMASASYFSRFFKKYTGFSPGRWREIHHVQK